MVQATQLPVPSRLSTVFSRFDGLALQPPAPVSAAELARHQAQADEAARLADTLAPLTVWAESTLSRPASLPALQAWCRHQTLSVGRGAACVPARLVAVAALVAPAAADARQLAERLAQAMDGSLRLAGLTGAAGRAWRLQVKLADAAFWREPAADHPWDAGWARVQSESAQQLAERFVPRRATLVLADAAHARALSPVLGRLAARAGGLPRPVRWLWVGTPAQTQALMVDWRYELA